MFDVTEIAIQFSSLDEVLALAAARAALAAVEAAESRYETEEGPATEPAPAKATLPFGVILAA